MSDVPSSRDLRNVNTGFLLNPRCGNNEEYGKCPCRQNIYIRNKFSYTGAEKCNQPLRTHEIHSVYLKPRVKREPCKKSDNKSEHASKNISNYRYKADNVSYSLPAVKEESKRDHEKSRAVAYFAFLIGFQGFGRFVSISHYS